MATFIVVSLHTCSKMTVALGSGARQKAKFLISQWLGKGGGSPQYTLPFKDTPQWPTFLPLGPTCWRFHLLPIIPWTKPLTWQQGYRFSPDFPYAWLLAVAPTALSLVTAPCHRIVLWVCSSINHTDSRFRTLRKMSKFGLRYWKELALIFKGMLYKRFW